MRKDFHEKTVALSLGVEPDRGLNTQVTVNTIKEVPGVSKVTWVNILALGVAGLAKDGPRYSSLEL